MDESLLEKIKTKIAEARSTLANNAKARENEQFKADIEAHIAKMGELMTEMQGKGDDAVETYLQKTNEAITKLEELMSK